MNLKESRKELPGFFGLALVLILALLPAETRALDTIRLSQTISDPAQLADDLGLFAKEGIRIQWTGRQAHGPAVLVTVAADENDFAGTVSSAVFLARAKGEKLKIFAAQTTSSAKLPLFRYLVKDGSPITGKATDFIGKKVVAQPTTITWYPLEVFLKENGVDPGVVQFISLPSPLAEVQALKEGQVDAITASQSTPPGDLLLAQGGYHFVPGVSDYEVLKLKQIGGWAAREDYLTAHPDVVRRFIKAVSEAVTWGNAHPVEAQARLDRINGVPAQLIPYYHWRPVGGDLLVDPASIRRWTKVLEDFGQIPRGSIRPQDVYTNAYNPNYRPSRSGI